MSSWNKGQGEEASRQRAIKRGDDGPKKSLGIWADGIGYSREESEPEEADRGARYVAESQ